MGPTLNSRAQGAIWGTCVGDALGGPVQFSDYGTFTPITDLEPVRPFKKPAGSYSDDGAMTLGLAQSFIDAGGRYDQGKSIRNYLEWLTSGYFGTSSEPWDMGVATREALTIWWQHGISKTSQTRVIRHLDKEVRCGNGSLMRIAPVGVVFWKDKDCASNVAREESMVTHPALACVEACVLFTSLIAGAMQGMFANLVPLFLDINLMMVQGQLKEDLFGVLKNELLKLTHPALSHRLSSYPLMGHYSLKPSSDVHSSGWVVDTIEVVLWAFFKFDTWEEGALAVVNLGGDSDTAGAIYGALAGVFYGVESIPQRWIDKMQNADFIRKIATDFARVVT
ncbi:hypothetical protein N7468_008783 [Penicillium chermesinum]|uniref:ADP-ribosylhydrolase ARH3 n=1 Tax=Penicillium chermesinum TaxID=63820 RepID=A0A9W9NJ47_9EURO|nr:uncharacterized protein N7468_008783 [Penicillium chermesinum]KAJ5219579.1 hypothetical protein N7468_008783 [Penicillium chermesinum]KAJ6153594.1 hypothetical protein N7470_006553 [Penicillium chermesinum]